MKTSLREFGESIRKWTLPVLSLIVAVLAIVVGYQMIKVNGIENGNRDIICQSRKLREKFKPATPLERAQLAYARQNGQDCK